MVPPLLDTFFKLLTCDTHGDVFNPWASRDPTTDRAANGPRARRQRLLAHFDTRPARLLVGEAAGYQGCHVSGIAFTSERLVMAGLIPRVSSGGQRLSSRPRPWSEPSATTVWGTLHALGLATDTILWNAFPWHPHQPGQLHSNRTPTASERVHGLVVLEALLRAYPGLVIFAVGRQAQSALAAAGRHALPLRHPSMGGVIAFRRGLKAGIRNSS